MRTGSGYSVLRSFTGKGGRVSYSLHDADNPPKDGFKWDGKEVVAGDGQLAFGIVLTHDCEIENDDRREHRLMGLMRPLAMLSSRDQDIIVGGGYYGRMYLPNWPEVGLDESYVDFRRITTVRGEALPDADRIASLTDWAREALQFGLIRYLTSHNREDPEA